MDIVSVLVGFIFGSVLGGIFSNAVSSWLLRAVPIRHKRSIAAVADSPRLYFKLVRNTEEKTVFRTIAKLFDAWENKDLNRYMSCWSQDAIRLIGAESNAEQTRPQIAESFENSCRTYSDIRIGSLTIEDIAIETEINSAVAMIRYRFILKRSNDSIPIVEDAREVYGMRRIDGEWIIASNIDHYSEVGTAAS